MVPGFANLLLAGLLAVSAAADVACRQVPNPLTLTVGLLGLAVGVRTGAAGVLSNVSAGAVVLLLLVIPWRKGVFGGGDVKLAAAVAIWIGVERLVEFLLVTALAGGVVSLAAAVAALATDRRAIQANATALVTQRAFAGMGASRKAPYAVAIVVGGAYVLWGGTQ